QDCAVVLEESGAIVERTFAAPVAMADYGQLVQVFENLLSNAVKYGVSGTERRLEVGSVAGEGEVRVYVRDFGPGIAPEHHHRIFGLFQRLGEGPDSTGVGLAIVQRVAEVHGGRAWVESEPGRGATFWVSFPDGE